MDTCFFQYEAMHHPIQTNVYMHCIMETNKWILPLMKINEYMHCPIKNNGYMNCLMETNECLHHLQGSNGYFQCEAMNTCIAQ